MRRHAGDLGACALIVIAVCALYHKAAGLWWTYDDAYHLHTVIDHRLRELFVSPALWRAMSNRLFTPLLQATYSVQFALFSASPRPFYIAQLAQIALAAMAVYVALRLWTRPLFAIAGSLLFVAGAPIASAATQLMIVHYFEAITLSAAATIAFVLALRRGRVILAVASSVLYFVAMLAKEIAVPLPLVLVLIPERDARARAKALMPHAVALAVYALWRWMMLGELFGGYGWAVRSEDVVPLLLALPRKIAVQFAGPNPAFGVLLGLGLAALVAIGFRTRRDALLLAVAICVAVVPIVPVSREMQPRYTIAAWLCLSAAAALMSSRRRTMGAVLAAAVLLLSLGVNRQAWRDEMRRARRMSDEGRFFFFEMRPDAVLRTPAIPPAAMGETKWLKEEYAHRPRGGTWYYDDFYPCAHDLAGREVWTYDAGGRRFVRRAGLAMKRYCGSLRQATLSAVFRPRGDTLFWELGPYRDGTFRFLLADGIQAFDVPPEDGFRLAGVSALPIRVAYRSPAGWVTYSPEIMVDFRRPLTSWRR